MDKQKQINEMHQILLSAGYDWWKTYPNGKTKSEYEAECFYNANYRKIPENAVVFTEEELFARDELLHKKDREYIKALEECINNRNAKACKETAEKFVKGFINDILPKIMNGHNEKALEIAMAMTNYYEEFTEGMNDGHDNN